jgi:hypothetical protein
MSNQLMEQSFGNAEVGQSTRIEQSGRVAEVQGAIIVAQKLPRNERAAVSRIMDACSRLSLANQAFFSFPKSGKTVSGASIHLMTEIARCWGHIQSGVSELSRDDVAGRSEAMAYSWDMQANVRFESRFIVVHEISTKKDGVKKLTDTRDIYELIANQGARRMRACIAKVIPSDVIAMAEDKCRETLKFGDGKPFGQRVSECIQAFSTIGVTREMLKKHLDGANPELMSIENLTELGILFLTIRRGERSVDEIFFCGSNGEQSGLAAVRAKNLERQSTPAPEPPQQHPQQTAAPAQQQPVTQETAVTLPPLTQPPSAQVELPKIFYGVKLGDLVEITGTSKNGPFVLSGQVTELAQSSIAISPATGPNGEQLLGCQVPLPVRSITAVSQVVFTIPEPVSDGLGGEMSDDDIPF